MCINRKLVKIAPPQGRLLIESMNSNFDNGYYSWKRWDLMFSGASVKIR